MVFLSPTSVSSRKEPLSSQPEWKARHTRRISLPVESLLFLHPTKVSSQVGHVYYLLIGHFVLPEPNIQK